MSKIIENAQFILVEAPSVISYSNIFYRVHPRRNDRFVTPGGIRILTVIAKPAISNKRPAKAVRMIFLNVMSFSLILVVENLLGDYESNYILHCDGECANLYLFEQIRPHTRRQQKRHEADFHAQQSLD